jgi:hypothetical protein
MRTGFKSVERGLEAGFPLRLYHKAKRLFWDPAALDFTQDRATYEALDPRAQDLLLRLTSLFLGGEEAVTLDLLPLVRVVAQEGRLEEEMYLTTFLLEEAKHVEFFARFLEEVASAKGGSPTTTGPTTAASSMNSSPRPWAAWSRIRAPGPRWRRPSPTTWWWRGYWPRRATRASSRRRSA